uniref:RelB leucine zipper domain-containing protein n=1 Tax=Ailuropoda melanoleuca TaxID=9646 RepID=A0A7N5JXN0_AILME
MLRGGAHSSVCTLGAGSSAADVPTLSYRALEPSAAPELGALGSADLSSLSLAVSRTTGEQPSTVPAHPRAQDGGGGNPVEAALGTPLSGVSPRSTSAFL